jgi:hypothetical protein
MRANRWMWTVLGMLVSSRPALAAEGRTARPEEPRVKPPIRGLVSMGAYRFVGKGGDPVNTLEHVRAKAGIFGGIVIIASWAQLQPEGPEDFDSSVIDDAMEEVRDYNAEHKDKPLAVRLRVWGGFMAPPWVQKLGGAPIKTVYEKKERVLGRFWSPAYRKAWAALQEKLAERYDSWPLIREVSMTSCMSVTAEPFYSPEEGSVQEPIRKAGFTEKAYKECLRGGLDDYEAWKATRIVLSVNPLRTRPGQGAGDPEFTMDLMRDCRQRLGVRCVFDNHNLDTEYPRPLRPIYALMKELGPEIVFQTWRTNPEDFDGTIKLGVQMGATSIELWQDYRGFPTVPNDQLKRWAKMVEANDSP